MEKSRRVGSAEQPREQDLTPGGVEQILAAHDEVDVLRPVVHRDSELVGPVAFAIADEQIAALIAWMLRLRTQPKIVETDDAVVEPHAKAEPGRFAHVFVPARAGIALSLEVGARALARVHQTAAAQRFERVLVDRVSLALTYEWFVGCERKPREVVEDCVLVRLAAALSIVIFDAEQDASAGLAPGGVPDMQRVQYVAEMQIPRRCRSEARDDRHEQ